MVGLTLWVELWPWSYENGLVLKEETCKSAIKQKTSAVVEFEGVISNIYVAHPMIHQVIS